MIYNNAQFMNAPLDILARRFRETLTLNQIAQIALVWPLFEKFLLRFKHEPIDEYEHFHAMMALELAKLQAIWVNHLADSIGLKKKRRRSGQISETSEQFLLRKSQSGKPRPKPIRSMVS